MRNKCSLVCNIFIFLIALGFSIYCLSTTGAPYLRWFTNLSNMLVAIFCALSIPYNIKALRDGADIPAFPHWLEVGKFVATIAVAITMVTVLTFLNYLAGLPYLLAGKNLFFHLISPLVALVTCCAFERLGGNFARKEWLWGILPLALYSVVYLVMVIIIGPENGGWNDFYGFNIIKGMWPISFVCMWALATGLSFLTWKLSGGKAKPKESPKR